MSYNYVFTDLMYSHHLIHNSEKSLPDSKNDCGSNLKMIKTNALQLKTIIIACYLLVDLFIVIYYSHNFEKHLLDVVIDVSRPVLEMFVI